MRLFDHHIHSTRSDGTVSLEDRAKSGAARPHGVSDHYPWPTGMRSDSDVLRYLDDAARLGLRVGIEYDLGVAPPLPRSTHDALDYGFLVPETGQKCQLVGQLHGTGGYDQDLETFLLTDDEYIFWHANTAAIPHSSWDTMRGSETTLAYDLPGAGTYHLVISNEMSPTDKTVQVKAQVKCAR